MEEKFVIVRFMNNSSFCVSITEQIDLAGEICERNIFHSTVIEINKSWYMVTFQGKQICRGQFNKKAEHAVVGITKILSWHPL
jgi:hypothetical protein